jgi:copper chaperone CopZ
MQTAVLNIDGMNGEGCADLVATVLANISGVSDVRVSLLNGQAKVRFDEQSLSPQQLANSLARAGYPTCATIGAEASGSCCGGCCH